jgi:hypothetical protein
MVSFAVAVGNLLAGHQLVNLDLKRSEVKALKARRYHSVSRGQALDSSSTQAHLPIAAFGGKVEVVLAFSYCLQKKNQKEICRF